MSGSPHAEARRAIAQFSSGSFLLTACYEHKRAGQIVQSAQPCADEPMLVCIAARKGPPIEPLIRDAHCFAICLFEPDDKLLLRTFGSLPAPGRGDPLDALVIARSPFVPGCVVRSRPIGVLNLEDEAGGDEKLICVPVDTTFPYYSDVGERQDLPSIVLQQIEHFFTHYKDLEAEKWVRVGKWGDADEARQITLEAIERYNSDKAAAKASVDATGVETAQG